MTALFSEPPRPGTPLPFDAWPAADQQAWNRAIAPGDIFTDAGAGSHWRAKTRDTYRASYGRYLASLEQQGLLTTDERPEARVTPARIAAYVEELRARLKPVSVWSYTSDVHNAAYRMFPREDWCWLRTIVNRLKQAFDAGSVSADRLLPIDEIYRGGLALMDRADREHNPYQPLLDSVHYRDGIALAMLAVTLLRIANFAAIRIGPELRRYGEGYVVVIPPHEVKNNQPFESELPGSLTDYMGRYLEHHRPRLLNGSESDQLWISLNGAAIPPHQLSQRITKVTLRRLGKAIAPHRFRHCAATSIATVSPELARIIRPLLGHKTITTSERYYNRASMLDASRRQADAIRALRAQLRQQLEDEEIER